MSGELAGCVEGAVAVLDEDDPEPSELRAPAAKGRRADLELVHDLGARGGAVALADVAGDCERGHEHRLVKR